MTTNISFSFRSRTYKYTYAGPFRRRDTFHITYEQLEKEQLFNEDIAPLLWDFLGVSRIDAKRLDGVVRQSKPNEDIERLIANFDELEYAF